MIPAGKPGAALHLVGVFTVGALGNIPGQDLMQQGFVARSESTARLACLVAGVLYLVFGLVPPALGLAANLLVPGQAGGATLPALAALFLSPPLAVLFVLVILSAVMSTVDSAILSPAGVMAQNLLPRLPPLAQVPPLTLNRLSVVLVTVVSVAMAFWGESAYALLESAYELPLVSLLVPLALGLYRKEAGGEGAALAAMVSGTGLWLVHQVAGWETALAPLLGQHAPLPVALTCAALALAAQLLSAPEISC